MKLRAGHIKTLRKRVIIVERVVVEIVMVMVVVLVVSSLNVNTNLSIHMVTKFLPNTWLCWHLTKLDQSQEHTFLATVICPKVTKLDQSGTFLGFLKSELGRWKFFCVWITMQPGCKSLKLTWTEVCL